jgi:type IV pilus assembly protein PilB
MTPDRIQVIRKMLEVGLISRPVLSQVIITCRARNIEILRVLANYAGLDSRGVHAFLEKYFGMTRIDLDDIVLNPEVVKLVPLDLARGNRIIPSFKVNGRIFMAVADPFNFNGIKELQKYTGNDCGIFLAPEEQILSKLDRLEAAYQKDRIDENSLVASSV